jgi:hypothetical protein
MEIPFKTAFLISTEGIPLKQTYIKERASLNSHA